MNALLLDHGVTLAMACAVGCLCVAAWLIRSMRARSAGTERMRQIAAAIEEGA